MGGFEEAALGTFGVLACAAALRVCLQGLRLHACFRLAHSSRHLPLQALLLLGGDKHREQQAAQLAAGIHVPGVAIPDEQLKQLAGLPIHVSSAHDDVEDVMQSYGVRAPRLCVDNRALDTVTNFTSMVQTFAASGISHVLILTSHYHLYRASALAAIILGSQGVAFTSVGLPSRAEEATLANAENRSRTLRDKLRAWVWLFTGIHGASLIRFTRPNRFREHRQRQLEEKRS